MVIRGDDFVSVGMSVTVVNTDNKSEGLQPTILPLFLRFDPKKILVVSSFKSE